MVLMAQLLRMARGLLSTLALTLSLGVMAIPAAGPAAASTPSSATAAYDSQQVFALINTERHAHGLAALRWNTRLTTAAHSHNLLMAKYNTLSHQLPGEASFGARITAVGYSWRAIGENCAWTSNWSLAGILAMHTGMYNEVAPNDGHRRNILSTTYRDVGIDIVMDAAHLRAWITEEFAAPL
jgi:uncharacterized protein YkwD